MSGKSKLNVSKRAGLFGLFSCLVVLVATAAAAEPLAIEIVSADVVSHAESNEPLVAFTMSDASKEAFAALTRANVGRKMALRVDGRTISAPVIMQPILGGSVRIGGNMTMKDARDIAARLRSGKARLEVEIVN